MLIQADHKPTCVAGISQYQPLQSAGISLQSACDQPAISLYQLYQHADWG
jgi:hypothetical protein